MARISWKEKKKNKEVLEEIGLKHTELLKTVKTRQLACYGHIRRHQSLQKSIMEGKINGKRQRVRRRKSWLGNIEETMTRRINECCEVALDREEWRRTIASNLWQETEQREGRNAKMIAKAAQYALEMLATYISNQDTGILFSSCFSCGCHGKN
ncbi:endonuclease-reverse transcriptase [Elysia marginata]|uniref:Endonuclease-reverse transcriptase n=1 Tax=Elysia marginata TaxID=1093978 RepID=A0AAV4JU01_9GAST|nr:endonuclease-reverse transcriptase [Elysia marginata]